MTIARTTNSPISPRGEKPGPMTADEARACIDAIRDRIDDVRRLAFDLHEREGWRSLGYPSWRECVTAEFGRSQSYLYRQLRAALIEREISPRGETDDVEIGVIPEKHLRPLATLATAEERREVWDEAVATAPEGKVTAGHVRAVVEKKAGPKPKPEISPRGETPAGHSRLNGVLVPDPPDVAKARKAGRIAPEVVVEIEDPEAGGEPGPDVEPESEPMTDAEWFASLPVWHQLGPGARVLFERDALAYRQVEEARGKFSFAVRSVLAAADRRGPLPTFLHRVRSFLQINHPRHWTRCPDPEHGGCGGKGVVDITGTCTICRGGGYRI